MIVNASIQDGTITISIARIKDTDRMRVARIEMALLKAYSRHCSQAWEWDSDDMAKVVFTRVRSNPPVMELVRKVLADFQIEV
jgi:hypothetical protein